LPKNVDGTRKEGNSKISFSLRSRYLVDKSANLSTSKTALRNVSTGFHKKLTIAAITTETLLYLFVTIE
jgi:hypothetical protein